MIGNGSLNSLDKATPIGSGAEQERREGGDGLGAREEEMNMTMMMMLTYHYHRLHYSTRHPRPPYGLLTTLSECAPPPTLRLNPPFNRPHNHPKLVDYSFLVLRCLVHSA